jgi:hypothetical protein
MHQIKQSSSSDALVFYMVDSTDHVTPKTGLSPTVTLSKNGGSFGSPTGAVSEISGGFYKVAGNATDTATLGMLSLKATATGADPVAMAYSIMANVPADVIAAIGTAGAGLTALGDTRIAYLDRAISSAVTLPTIPTDWIAAAGVKADAVTKIQTGLATPTNITAATGVVLSGVVHTGATIPTVTTLTNLPTIGAIATQVRTELTVELGRIDAAITTRMATFTYTAPATPANVESAQAAIIAATGAQISL